MKRNKILGLYFGACAVGTGLFFPFGVLSLLCSLSKCNVAGSGLSAIGKIGKNILSPALSNALPVAGLAISALDLLVKDDNSKSSNNSSKSMNFDYNQTFPKTDYSYMSKYLDKEDDSLLNPIKFKSYLPETPKTDYSYMSKYLDKATFIYQRSSTIKIT